MQNLNDHWKTDFIVKKYHDIRPWAERFKSEVYFLERIVKPGMRVLDVGCATGDLYHGLKEKFGEIEYTGLDISEPLIERAKELAPDVPFYLGDIFSTDSIAKESFDLVTATGVFQHEPNYKELLDKMLEYTKVGGYVLFDVKLFHTHLSIVDIEQAYGDHGDHRVYYNVLNYQDALTLLRDHKQVGENVEMYGYYSGVNDTVHLPASVEEEVCSAHVLVQKVAHRDSDINVTATLPDTFTNV